MTRQSGEIAPPPYVTTSVADLHILGEGLRPIEQQTTQFILAKALTSEVVLPVPPGANRISIDTIEPVEQNAQLDLSEDENWGSARIRLARPLFTGKSLRMGYMAWFGTRPLPPMYRREIGPEGIDNVEIAVAFDYVPPPAHIWLGEWDGGQPDSKLLSREPWNPELMDATVEDSPLYVRFVGPVAAGKTIGFFWEV